MLARTYGYPLTTQGTAPSVKAGIDLPLKALVWQDEAGKVWLVYNDPAYLASRHGITKCGEVVQNMSKALAGFSAEATKK